MDREDCVTAAKRPAVSGAWRRAVFLLTGTVVASSLVAGTTGRAHAATPPPAQWVAKQYTELLGRAPTATEWATEPALVSNADCSTAVGQANLGRRLALSAEFALDYPEATAKPARVVALVRAAFSREPTAGDMTTYYTPYSAGTATWHQTVDAAYDSAASTVPAMACSASNPGYGFGWSRPLDVLGTSRSQAALQAELDAALPGTTVFLQPSEVVRIGGTLAPGNQDQQLVVPAGVTLATTGITLGPRQYAGMGRLAADGQVCAGSVCNHSSVVRLASGARLVNVWVDSNGSGQVGMAGVQTDDSAGTAGTDVEGSRLSDAGPNGAAVRLDGFATTGVPCAAARVAANLITGYAGSHAEGSMGQPLWATGVDDGCENATISGNQLVDMTDRGIAIHGERWRRPLQPPGDVWHAQSVPMVQRSQVTSNTILSAGSSAFAALDADPMGECTVPYGTQTTPTTCRDLPDVVSVDGVTEPEYRDFTGSLIAGNSFWTGPVTSYQAGLLIGGGAEWAWSGPWGTGATFSGNTVPAGLVARVNTAILTSGMTNVTLADNTVDPSAYVLVDANPAVTDNPCPEQVWGYTAATASFAATSSQTPPLVTRASWDCMAPPPPAAMEQITVAPDNRTFAGATSGAPFTPWGENQYTGHGGIFAPQWSGPGDTPQEGTLITDLRTIKKMGQNTVRIFLDFADFISPPSTGYPDGTPNTANLARLQNIVGLAAQDGLYLDVTGFESNVPVTSHTTISAGSSTPVTLSLDNTDDMPVGGTLNIEPGNPAQRELADITAVGSGTVTVVPHGGGAFRYSHAQPYQVETTAHAPAWYDALTANGGETHGRWQAQAEFWSVVATQLKGDTNVLDYDLQNEPVVPGGTVNRWCAGWIGSICYPTFITQVGTNRPDGLTGTAIAKAWIATLITAIRGTGDTHMITVGQLPNGSGGFDPTVIGPQTQLSYVSVHEYPGESSNLNTTCASDSLCDIALQDVHHFQQGKPLVIEETFSLPNDSGNQMTSFLIDSRPDAAGWFGQWPTTCTPLQLNDPPGGCGDPFGFVNTWGQIVESAGDTLRLPAGNDGW